MFWQRQSGLGYCFLFTSVANIDGVPIGHSQQWQDLHHLGFGSFTKGQNFDRLLLLRSIFAPVVELADTQVLGACPERGIGSSPVWGIFAKILEGSSPLS